MPVDTKGRTRLDPELVKYILSFNQDDLTTDDMAALFTERYNAKEKKLIPPMIPKNTYIDLKANEYINEKDVRTTPGLLFVNKLLIEGPIRKCVPGGYFNETMNKKGIGKLFDWMSKAVKDGEITTDELLLFLKRYELFGFKNQSGICPSVTMKTILPLESVMKEKEKLLKNAPRNKEGKLELLTMVNIEDTLVDMAKEELKDDPGMLLYNSGARGNFSNDYKMTSIIAGPVKNPSTGEYDLLESNFVDGIKRNEIPIVANSVVNGGYPKAVGTQKSGYDTKKFYQSLQSIQIDQDHESDCHTKVTNDIVITADLKNSYIDRYIVVGGKHVLLTPENIDQYVGKLVHMRSPLYCTNDKICHYCAGERFYKLGITEAGASSVAATNFLMNKGFKMSHVVKVTYSTVDPDKLLL